MVEHRAAAAPEPLSLRLVATAGGDAHLTLVEPGDEGAPGAIGLEPTIVATLTAAGQPLGRTALRDTLRVRNERLGEALANLARRGAIVRVGDRWSVPVPAPT